ncbi:hypothetical protein [Actinocorallia longicatena]|uniref:Uncharacterized protein n=1 Tax=Actinocorallia longicatena TaxID=111803 RepID=A0ABP6QRZ1_9ACTN
MFASLAMAGPMAVLAVAMWVEGREPAVRTRPPVPVPASVTGAVRRPRGGRRSPVPLAGCRAGLRDGRSRPGCRPGR